MQVDRPLMRVPLTTVPTAPRAVTAKPLLPFNQGVAGSIPARVTSPRTWPLSRQGRQGILPRTVKAVFSRNLRRLAASNVEVAARAS